MSSGGVSAGLHLVYGNGSTENLFHAVWAESGAVQPIGYIDAPQPQTVYNTYVASLNCSNTTNTLECIRQAPIDAVTNASAAGTGVVWTPNADGSVFEDLPQQMILDGPLYQFTSVALERPI